MSYIYFGSSTAYTELVDATQASLNEVAPNYFELNADGSLKLTPAVSAGFVSDMHATGISVVPFLTNNWNRGLGIAALNNRVLLSEALADAVARYDLDGVNIDIENLTPAERSSYVDFIRLLRQRMPDKTIAVAVAPNPWGTASGWQGSFDYAGLAQYSDYLMIMAYDEHYAGGPAGPVASLSFAEKSVKYALGLVPKEKIVLGLPFYGRFLCSGSSLLQGGGVSNSRVEQLIRTYRGTVSVDWTSMSSRAVITIGAKDPKPVVNGITLTAGTYTIWYDNAQTLKAKLALITQYGLKGAGSWSLGQEDVATWDYYRLWLNGCTFADVETSWAKDYILSAYLKGWITGADASTFHPNASLTRAEAAAILVRCLGLPVSRDEAYIETARKYSVISGVGGNIFAPDRAVTREEIAVMLYNMRAQDTAPAQTSAAFTDVSSLLNPWSYEAIEALSQIGVITGYKDGSFRPGGFITRAEMTAMVSRLP